MKYTLFFFITTLCTTILTSCSGENVNSAVNKTSIRPDSTLLGTVYNDSAKYTPTSHITFAFAGDVMMGTTYPETAAGAFLPADDGSRLLVDATTILSQADIAAVNLEGTLLDGGGTPKKCKDPTICYAFRTPTHYVRNLTQAGIDFVSIANNHINDFGTIGVESTTRTLTNAGIAYAGLTNAPCATLQRHGLIIGFTAFSPSRGTLLIHDLSLLSSTVRKLKQKCHLVVVSFHGGAEGAKYTRVPHATEMAFGENRGNVEKFAHAAIDAGADIVFGHGPHVARAAELYKQHLILYSLGNFCTPYRVNISGISGYAPVVVVKTDAKGHFTSGRIHSFKQQRGNGPHTDLTNAVAQQIATLSRCDFPKSTLKIAPDGTLSH